MTSLHQTYLTAVSLSIGCRRVHRADAYASDRPKSGAPPAAARPTTLLPGKAGNLVLARTPFLNIPGTRTPPGSSQYMMEKSWNAVGAPVAPQRALKGTRFLTAAFGALVLIAGLDAIFPSLKHRLIPELGGQPQAGAGHASKSFEWSQVRVHHSRYQSGARPCASLCC